MAHKSGRYDRDVVVSETADRQRPTDGIGTAIAVGDDMEETTVTRFYEIQNAASGISLGVWQADDEEQAYAFFCRAAGITPDDIDAELVCVRVAESRYLSVCGAV
jgi:hypothetical protein